MATDIIRVTSKNKTLAIIITPRFKQKGIRFFVPEEYPQQLACMKRPKGYIITPHIHKPVTRRIRLTQEVLIIRRGRVRIDFYDEWKRYAESRIVKKGDIVFLAFGGHGFEFIEKGEIIEVKQGPFIKDAQSIRFEAVSKDRIKFKK
jgi:hypothetical protein